MTSVNINAALVQKRHIVGCELPISITLTNVASNNESLLVQPPASATPFEYELISPNGVYRLSKRLFEQASRLHGVVSPKEKTESLAPGESRTYAHDVANWMTETIPTGHYELHLYWRSPAGERIAAPPLAVRIEPLNATRHACVGDMGGQSLVSAFTHEADSVTLLQRSSHYARPTLGHGLTLEHASSVGGIAIASELDDPSPWRWVVWLTDGNLCGAIHWGTQLVKRLEPTPIGVSNPTLLSTGWQTRRAAAVFAVLGERGGQAAVDVILIPQIGKTEHCVYTLQCSRPDLAVAGSYFPGLGVLELILGFERTGRTQLLAQNIDISLTDCASPRMLLEVDGTLRALGIAPRIKSDSAVDAIIGDTFYRVSLDAGTTEQLALASPSNASQWSIPLVPHSSCPVLCKVNDALMFVRAKDGSDWQQIASDLRDTSHERLVHLGPTDGSVEGTLVASYVDDRLGYTVVTLASE